jgi:hypothetical protein
MSYKNKFISKGVPVMVLITLFLGISAAPVSAETIVSVDDVYVEPGNGTSVPIVINNVTDLGVADIILVYNQSVVRITNVENSEFDFMNPVINESAGTVRMVAIDYNMAGLSGDVKLADITLEAVGNADETGTLNLVIKELKEAGMPETAIPAETDNATFGIFNPPASPTILSSTTGCHWINWTWTSGSNSDFVEVIVDGVWKENCTKQYYNCSYPPHAVRTISLRGHNSSLDRYSEQIAQAATIPNYVPVAIAMSVHRYNNVGKICTSNAIFNASSSYDPDGSITYYQWDFGDGTPGTGGLTEHIYESCNWNGTGYDPFIVGLVVSDDIDSLITDTVTIPVNVYIAGDANGDGVVNIGDSVIVGYYWGSTCNTNADGLRWYDNPYADMADMNNDGNVNIGDTIPVGYCWGHTAW